MRLSALLAVIAIRGAVAAPETMETPATRSRLPVREVTVFKDGHAFVLHEGALPTDAAGRVVVDSLPTPVIGTFWPYCADKNATLVSVVAGKRKVALERTASTVRELLEGNVGAEVLLTEESQARYAATVLGFPRREVREAAEAHAQVVLLRTDDGVKAVAVDRIRDVTFKAPPRERFEHEDTRNRLVLNLAWRGTPARTAEVGLLYVQKGLRWIPSYKIDLDGRGRAALQLQATLLNELADLEDATVHLVIGVPTFAFKETPDPIALQEAVARLSSYFNEGDRTANAFSNAMMTQVSRMGEAPSTGTAGEVMAPDLLESARSEDLFVFTVPHVTLRKDERMVLRVAEYSLPYQDVFTLDLPFAPPREVRSSLSGAAAEAARLLAAPKVMHKVRLTNNGPHPLTTAPALVLRDGRLVAQGMMTYTGTGARLDLALTAAVDIQAQRTETETKRTLGALRWDGDNYAQVDLAGKVSVTNRRSGTVVVEVARHVVGGVDSADHGGVFRKANAMDPGEDFTRNDHGPIYPWPGWWWQVNPVGHITWDVKLEPGQSVDLGYTWHYYWR